MLGAPHQLVKVGKSVAVTGGDLRVDDDGSDGKAADAVAELWEAICEVVAAARKDHGLKAILVKLGSPAIELDLVNPALAGGRTAL